MIQINLYLNDRGEKWEMGTPLETWGRGREKRYRFRPLGQDRGFDHGLMGDMADECNYHATEMKPLEINYEEALDQLLERFLSDFERGNIKANQSLKDFSEHSDRFFAQWAEGKMMYISSGDTAKEALKNLKAKVIAHIKRLKEDKSYRDFHVCEGGPRFDYASNFPHITAALNSSKRGRRVLRKLELGKA